MTDNDVLVDHEYYHYDTVHGGQEISKMPPNIFNRYNVSGFVEELPQLPQDRWGHACAALPATGVRPDQTTC